VPVCTHFKFVPLSFFDSPRAILVADTLKTTTPLLNKVILTWLAESYIYYNLSDQEKASGIIPKPKGIGYGIGLAFGLFAMQGKRIAIHDHCKIY
jgi:hypothetical protein